MIRYNIDSSKVSDQQLKPLKAVYNNMPETCGCHQCKEVNGEEQFWCCKTLNPSMYYVEFLYVWRMVKNTFGKEQRVELTLRAIDNYLDNSRWKGCVFFNEGCMCYERRPLYCRLYGIIPKDSWNKKVETLHKQNGDDYYVRSQCDLVSTADGTLMVSRLEDEWFEQITATEKSIGINSEIVNMHDAPQGPYRTFHDHLLLELFEEEFLGMLTSVRITNPSKEDIKATIEVLRKTLKESDVI